MADNIAGRTICAFGEACAWPTQSFVEKFPDEFADGQLRSRCRRRCRRNTLPEDLIDEPKIADRAARARSRLGKSGRAWNDLESECNLKQEMILRPH